MEIQLSHIKERLLKVSLNAKHTTTVSTLEALVGVPDEEENRFCTSLVSPADEAGASCFVSRSLADEAPTDFFVFSSLLGAAFWLMSIVPGWLVVESNVLVNNHCNQTNNKH
jgi:hypothetical protein